MDRDEPGREYLLMEEAVALEWKRFASQTTAHRRLLDVGEITFGVVANIMFDDVCLTLSKMILTDDICEEYQQVTHEFAFPTSAWQHFKMDHVGNWLMRKFVDHWPIKWETSVSRQEVHLKTSAVFPDNRMYPEDFGKPVIIRSLKIDPIDG